ncbi:MAG TPA: NUDIX domain-containing protein [Gaiellaceae bacterium]|nr:NUDIX domain-containing protein [Gaiellaceae bacterium]
MRPRFCGACGAALPALPPTVCAGCGTEIWLNAKPCANAIVVSAGKVLLMRRARAPWRDGWCAPGGFCEPTEHPALAAERETLEEAGVRARVTTLLGIWLDAYADEPADPEAERISVAYYLAEPVPGASAGAVDAAEVSETGWFPLDDLPEPLVPPGTLASVLDAARKAIDEGRTERYLPDLPASE